jgi:hypothetical protein
LRVTTFSSLTSATRNERDADRLGLLDRIAEHVPEIDLDQQSTEWITLDDGHEALLVNGGGFDGGSVIRVEWLSGPEAFLAVIAAVLIPLGSWRWGG